jgi:hypothetical protein
MAKHCILRDDLEGEEGVEPAEGTERLTILFEPEAGGEEEDPTDE